MTFQAYLDTIHDKTGKDAAGLRDWADGKGFSQAGLIRPEIKAGQVVSAARDELGLGTPWRSWHF
jgi:Domain of unknown function (DUF4287)